MLRKILLSAAVVLFAVSAIAQSQTPRQALIEMFSGRDPKVFERHLPKVMQARLAALAPEARGRFMSNPTELPTAMGRKNDIRWFEAGPILLLMQDPNSRLELRIEKENMQGDRDDFELSMQFAMSGKSYGDGNDSRLLLTMQKEDGIWKLSEVGFFLKMKLDGTFIEAFAKQMGTAVRASGETTLTASTTTPSRRMSAQDLNPSESVALLSLRQMLAAQTQYRASNPDAGFACDTAALSVQEVGDYRTMIVGCKGTPVANYKITLTPVGMGIKGRRAFCADETGVVRYSDDGRGITCLSENNRIE